MADLDQGKNAAQPTDTPGDSAEIRALADELIPLFYDELRSIARRVRGAVGAGATLETTALVHETYFRLRGTKGWADDSHFLNAASLAMRHVLVDRARERLAAKRGAGMAASSIDTGFVAPEDSVSDHMLVRLNDALEQLGKEAPRLGWIVQCRYFGGYDDETTARALKLSVRTVRRDWAVARSWLHRELAV